MIAFPRPLRPVLAAILVALVPVSAFAATAAEAAAGTALVKRYADAIVTLELVAVSKSGRGGTPQEQKIEANATVISASGLTVTSLTLIDPRAASGGRGGRSGDSSDTEFKEVKLRLADNTEINARVVLKDADLDLAFIAPDVGAAPGRQFVYVDLDKPAEAVVLGTTYYDVTRVTKLLQRAPIVQLSTIIGIVEKPRRVIIADQQTPGCAVFDGEGRVLGISLNYYTAGRSIGLIVVPAVEVADMAKQALAQTKPLTEGGKL